MEYSSQLLLQSEGAHSQGRGSRGSVSGGEEGVERRKGREEEAEILI